MAHQSHCNVSTLHAILLQYPVRQYPVRKSVTEPASHRRAQQANQPTEQLQDKHTSQCWTCAACLKQSQETSCIALLYAAVS
jgi:hypothetical protein